MHLDRRQFMTGAVAATALGAPGVAPGQSPSAVSLALSWINNVEYGGLWIALERGYFTREGLEVKVIPGGPNAPSPLIVVAAGNATFGIAAWLPFLDAVGKGNDFVLVAATFPVSPLGIASLADKPILKAQDIVGKRILAQGPNERTAIEATLALNGLPNTWTFVPAGFSPEPLMAKQGDGYTCFVTNQPITLERMGLVQGKDFQVATFDSMGFRQYASGLFTTRQMLERERPKVVGFVRALVRGWKDNEKEPTVAPQLAVSKYGRDLGLDLKQQTRQNELQIPLTKGPSTARLGLLALDPEIVAGPMYAAAKATGRTNLPPPSKVIDTTIVAEAHKGL